MTALLVALGAAVGAPVRFAVGHLLDDHRFAVGTLLVNVAGSTLLGLFVGWRIGGDALALLGIGFCGGSHDVLRLRGADARAGLDPRAASTPS